MKKIIQLVLISICNIAVVTAVNAAQALDRIVAIVNDTVITQTELTEATDIAKKQFLSMNTSVPAANVLRKQVLTQLINKNLQLQAAEQSGMKVSDKDLERAISSIAKNNHLSVKELFEKIAEQGMSRAAYLKNLRQEILLQQIQQKEVGPKIVITPEEVASFMKSSAWQAYNTKEYHLQDLLIALPDAPTANQILAAKQRAQQLLAKIHNGLNFVDAADSETKDGVQGGDLGWRKLPEIPTAFADQLIHLKQNEIMGPIQTSNGFHLVKLAGIRGINNKESASAQRQQVQQLIFQRKMEEGVQNWVMRLRSAATINEHPEG